MKNIIFDFGGVILNLDISASLRAFERMGIKQLANSNGTRYRDPVFNLHETGAVTDQQFREAIKKLTNQSVTDDEIDEAWTGMLLDIPKDRVDYILDLKKKYRVFLLSNTNHIHQLRFEPYFKHRFGFSFHDLFERVYYSHDEGLRKPDNEAFLNVLNQSGLKAGETLFVDDSLENIEAAGKLGINTYHIQPGYKLSDINKVLS